jgi:hypothetical protein
VKVVFPVFRNHSATSFVWKGWSSSSRSRLSNSVISSAVLGFLILFNAREMCSSRRQREFGLLRISASSYRKMTLAYSDRGPDVAWVWRGCKPNSKSLLARRQQLAQQIPNRYRLVFSDAANQTVGALEALLVRFDEAGGAIVELDFTDAPTSHQFSDTLGGGWLYPMEGGPRPIPGLQAGESFAWTSDPRFMYVYQWKQSPVKVDRLNVLTGQRQLFREMTPPDVARLRSISHVHFSSDGRAYVYSYTRLLSELYLVKGLK